MGGRTATIALNREREPTFIPDLRHEKSVRSHKPWESQEEHGFIASPRSQFEGRCHDNVGLQRRPVLGHTGSSKLEAAGRRKGT